MHPFLLGYRSADFRLIAFFDGHPNYTGVECLQHAASKHAMAVTTYSDNSQDYYLVAEDPELVSDENVRVRRSSVHCQVAADRTQAGLAFEVDGQRVVLDYRGHGPPSSSYAGTLSPQGHNPNGGLIVMHTQRSAIANAKTRLTWGGAELNIKRHPASKPPHFIGLQSYLVEGLDLGFVKTYTRRRLREADGILGPSSSVQVRVRQVSPGHVEIQSLTARDPRAPNGLSATLAFEPSLPNPRVMKTGQRMTANFRVAFSRVPKPVVSGTVVVERHEKASVFHLRPQQPDWAKQNRKLTCTIDRAGQSACVADR